jgi:hypothetical protein
MPALPNVPGVIKTIFKHGLSTGEDLFNIFYWAYTGADTNTTLLDFVTDLAARWGTHVMPQLSADTTLTAVEGIDLTSNTSPEQTAFTSIAGSKAPPITPANCALVVSEEIARRYRGGHPRKYMGGLTNGQLASPSFWNVSDANAMSAALASFVAVVMGDNPFGGTLNITDLVNVSYRTGGAIRAVPVVDHIITFTAKEKVCSQRRRTGKLGS